MRETEAGENAVVPPFVKAKQQCEMYTRICTPACFPMAFHCVSHLRKIAYNSNSHLGNIIGDAFVKSARRKHEQPGGARREEAPPVTWRHQEQPRRATKKAIKGRTRSNKKGPTSSQDVPERTRKSRGRQEEAGEYTSARRNHEQPRGARRAEAPQVTWRRQEQPRKATKNNEQPRRSKGGARSNKKE